MRFLPDLDVPELLDTDRFRIQPLTIHNLVKDYDAVMTSREPLWDQFGQAWGWPLEDLTLEQDLIDLARHQPEPNGARHLPMRSCAQTSACSSAASTPSPPTSKALTPQLPCGSWPPTWTKCCMRLCGWLAECWPFTRVAWPGRDLPWEEYDALPDRWPTSRVPVS
jgi:hypothetical protein